MKKIKTLLAAACFTVGSVFYTSMYAQAPQKFSYQTVVRNASQGLVQNQNCGIKVTIRSGSASGTAVYAETHNKTSNINGLVTLEIGGGTVSPGFNDTLGLAVVDWSSGSYFIETQIDPTGGTNYTISGTSQLLSVPYALNARDKKWFLSGNDIVAINTGNVMITGNDNVAFGLDVQTLATLGIIKKTGFNPMIASSVFNPIIFGQTDQMGVNSNILGATLTERMRIDGNGFVGIGVSNPQAYLDVAGNNQNVLNFWSYTQNGVGGLITGYTLPVSIRASGAVVAYEFCASSDKRIKNILSRTNNASDLTLLNKIKVTDYKFIDEVANGNKVMKKVIAQELEEVYPNAVNKNTAVIPDIYTSSKINDGNIEIANNLKTGDKVKLIFENESEVLEVLEANPNSFKVNSQKNGNVFVYGKEVNDFRTVDYDALTTLNISATQELFKMITELQAENVKLKEENNNTKASIESILQQMQTLNAKVSTLENPVTGQVEK